ncbi:MAG: dihydrolipoamide acetyltransferase family protein [Acidobacteriota bacterium]
MPYEFRLPDLGEGVVEGEIVTWLIREGETLEEDQPMVEVMTDKATVEIPSPVSGKVIKTVGSVGQIVEVGATMVIIEADGSSSYSRKSAPEKPPEKSRAISTKAASASSKRALATPAVRKFARARGVDLSQLPGTGPGGRITREDVMRATQSSGVSAAPASSRDLPTEDIPYRGLRKKIGDHLTASKRFAPHYTYVEEVDMTQLVAVRRKFLSANEGSRLTYLPFLMKALVRGLRQFPLLNSTLDEDREVIQLKKYYNFGVATATEQGLIVPVVKNVDRKSILELTRDIMALADEARRGKVKLEDLRDGTFTLTSLGPLGGVLATPIINYPEVAILGVHKITRKPVVREGRIVIRDMMYLSLSLDHRVVDGAVGARFLHHVLPYIENPGLLAVL